MELTLDIIITDDKERYRRLIREMLESFPVTIIGEAANGKELLDLLRNKKPDVVLLDLEMPVMDGKQAFEAIRKSRPEVKIIILSSYNEGVLMENYIERGAGGYIPKDEMDPNVLMNALEKVSKGGKFLYQKPIDSPMYTPRQKEIMPLIFEGMTNDEIAGEVCMGKRAVEKQRHKIYEKSGTTRLIDFYKYAFTKGLHFLGRLRKDKRLA